MITKRERQERQTIVQKLKKLFNPAQYEAYKAISKSKKLQERVTEEAVSAAAKEIRRVAKEQGIALTTEQAGGIAGLMVWGWRALDRALEIPDPQS